MAPKANLVGVRRLKITPYNRPLVVGPLRGIQLMAEDDASRYFSSIDQQASLIDVRFSANLAIRRVTWERQHCPKPRRSQPTLLGLSAANFLFLGAARPLSIFSTIEHPARPDFGLTTVASMAPLTRCSMLCGTRPRKSVSCKLVAGNIYMRLDTQAHKARYD